MATEKIPTIVCWLDGELGAEIGDRILQMLKQTYPEMSCLMVQSKEPLACVMVAEYVSHNDLNSYANAFGDRMPELHKEFSKKG